MVMTCGTSRDMTKIDTFCTAKAELDSSFPGSQCQLPGFKNLHYFDMNLNCGALLHVNAASLKVKQIFQHLR